MPTAAIAAEGLERVGDRLLHRARAERLGELQADVGGLAGRVPLWKTKAQDVLRPEGPDADPGDDAGVHAAGDGHDGPTPPEFANGLRRPFGEPVERGGRIERFDGSV